MLDKADGVKGRRGEEMVRRGKMDVMEDMVRMVEMAKMVRMVKMVKMVIQGILVRKVKTGNLDQEILHLLQIF